MKKLKSILAIVTIVSIVSSCKKEKSSPGAPCGGVSQVHVSSYQSHNADFSIAFFAVDGDGNAYENLKQGDVTIDDFTSTSGHSFSFSNFNLGTLVNYGNTSYSACMLMDQSGSITGTDPNDLRIDAAKIFCNHLGSSDNVMLGAFASNGYLGSDLTWYSSFTHNGASLNGTLDNLASSEGGGTPLYSSTYAAINKTFSEAPNYNKAVIVFTDGEDTDGGKTLSDITALHNQKNVNVFTVGLSNSVNTGVLSDMANNCNGAFIYAGDAKQLVSAFGYLGNVLGNTAHIYQLSAHVSTGSNYTFSSGSSIITGLKIKTPDGDYLYLPFKLNF